MSCSNGCEESISKPHWLLFVVHIFFFFLTFDLELYSVPLQGWCTVYVPDMPYIICQMFSENQRRRQVSMS